MLQLRIMNQNISYYATSRIVADSQGYLRFTIETSEEWNEYVKVVQFTKDGKTYDVPDVKPGIQYIVPWEALVGGGTMFVSLYGISGETNRATTNELEITVHDSGFHEGDPSEDPTPDKFQEFVNQVINAKNDAESARDEAKKYADEAKTESDRLTVIADEVYKNAQIATNAANTAKNAANDAVTYSESAKEYASEAEKSAVKAGESEVHASTSEAKAKASEENAKKSEENASQFASNASLSADKAEANQQIVTETKADIDVIYEDIQNRQQNIVEINNDIDRKKQDIDGKYEEITNIYTSVRKGAKYLEFNADMQTETPEGETVEGWTQTTEGDYERTLDWDGSAILNIQMLNDAGNYVITSFVDINLYEQTLVIKSIAPFAGRIALYALLYEEVTESGSN